MQNKFSIIVLILVVSSVCSGCISGGLDERVVTDMHKRVDILDRDLEPALSSLNENAAALIQRVNENERQVRLLTSLVEENQHKIDKLLKMLHDLKVTLYRYWGIPLRESPSTDSGRSGGGIQILPPSSSTAEDVPSSAAAPAVSAAPSPSPSAQEAKRDYAEAKVLYDSGDFQGAALAFSGFLRSYPLMDDGHKAQFWLGKSLLNQDQYARAVSAFDTLRREYPDSSYMAYGLHNQAVALFKLGERNRAIALMEEVVEKYPTSDASIDAERDLRQLRGDR